MKKVLIMAAAVWIFFAVMIVPVKAAETGTSVAGTVLKTDADVKVYQEAAETSDVTAELAAGTAVLVTEDNGKGWSRIIVKEVTGYIRTEHLVLLNSSDEMDQEFEQVGNNYHMIFNEVQQLENQRSQTRIWGTVIAVLTVGVFAAGIIPVIRKNREDEKNRTKSGTVQ